MAAGSVMRWRRPGIWPVVAFLGVVLLALHLMSDAVQRSDQLSRVFVPLLGVVLIGLSMLALLLVINLVKLVRRYRRQAAGSRLTGRMVLMFAVIALVPVSVVYYYSLSFLLRGIDSWFDVRLDQAMKDALELNKASLAMNQRLLVKYTQGLISDIHDSSDPGLALDLVDLRDKAGARELTLMRDNGQLLAFSSEDPTKLVPDLPSQEVLQQLRDGSQYVTLYPRSPSELLIRVLVRDPKGRPLLLQALFPTSEHVSRLSARLEDAYNRYRELAYLRQSLKFSFTLTLSLVVIFSLMTALIAAFHSARRLVAPVADIAQGTRAVAEGDFSTQLPVPRHDDELAFLVTSFNVMTRQLARARDSAAQSRQEVEAQRAYLETVLGRLSNGVMAFDAAHWLRTANDAAHQILRLDLGVYLGRPLGVLSDDHERLRPLVEALRGPLAEEREWREEVTLFSGEGRQVLLCRSTPFTRGEGQRGYVLVFDDITTLIRAQRDAAWSEVARRLAHEIKNPLTPIQLSAERLRRKYLGRMGEEDGGILDRATHTIIQQVEAMKAMVNAFSDYARPPNLQPEPLSLDLLIGDVLELYQGADGNGAVRLDLQAAQARIKGDPLRLRQVLHNLVKNAQEATEGREDGLVRVRTRMHTEEERCYVELQIQDNGPGLSEAIIDRLFEPYVTTKTRGTGLGLAIVKKIVEEHGGIIWAENCAEGACVTLRMPVAAAVPLHPAAEPVEAT
jgi:two-component system, NtrC family, nitrogen regulation sensor histidine kinase NtrY